MLSRERQTFARRGFLSGLAALPVAVVVPVPVPLAVAAAAVDAEAMWAARMRCADAYRATDEAYQQADDMLPWWAKSGPSFQRPDGSIFGEHSCFPAIQLGAVPNEGFSYLIRPTPTTIERDYQARKVWDEADATDKRDRALAALHDRKAAAKAEKDRIGMAAFEDANNAACDALIAADAAITNLETTSPAITAMQLMVEAMMEARLDETISGSGLMNVTAIALRGLLPMLTGEIAAAARDFIEDGDRPLECLRIWGVSAVA